MNNLKKVDISFRDDEFINISDILSDKLIQLSQEIAQRKKECIIDALLVNGIHIDLELESKRRFKSIACVRDGSTETYYYNDGSIEGRKLVSFKTQSQTNDNSILTNTLVKIHTNNE